MQREFVAVPQFWTVGKTIDYLRAARDTLPEDFYDLIVIDPAYHIVGEIPLNRLVCAQRSMKIDDLSLEETHPIPALLDQEEVATIFRNEGLASAPVVDDDNRLIGIITYDDVMYVIDQEAEEDILKLGGLKKMTFIGQLFPLSCRVHAGSLSILLRLSLPLSLFHSLNPPLKKLLLWPS